MKTNNAYKQELQEFVLHAIQATVLLIRDVIVQK